MILSGIFTIIVGIILNFIFLPAINIQSFSFWFLIIVLFFFFCSLTYFTENEKSSIISGYIGVFLIIIIIILSIISSPLVSSSTYKNRITITENNFNTDIPQLTNIKSIPLMDTESAKILGNRTLGELTDLVSQYEVSNDYYTIQIEGQPWKIAPLEYANIFKWFSNHKEGIPGYILVNPITNEAKFVRMKTGYQYSPSAIFKDDLIRSMRKSYLNELFEDYTFQVDDEGNPYWVISTIRKNTVFGASTMNGAILLNAVTGEHKYYSLEEIPTWVDSVYTGDFISELYNGYGKYQDGFFNSMFGQKGCTKTTDDFGYLMKDDDVFIYTGITSLASDKSNLGFIMVNSRTGEYIYYPCAGADEHSAMNAAEGVIQNFGYKASFPSLVNVSGEPTYVMVLKDNNGLVKMYSMVNAKNYTIVTVEDTLAKTYSAYLQSLKTSGKKLDVNVQQMNNLKEVEIIVSDIKFILVEGNTIVYITDTENHVYKQNFKENEELIFVKVGSKYKISYEKDNTNKIIDIVLFE